MGDKVFQLPAWDDARFEVQPDPELLRRLTEQMLRADPSRVPAECWQLTEAEINAPLREYLSALNGPPGFVLLQDTLGKTALTGDDLANMRYAKWQLIPQYEPYLRRADGQGLLAGVSLEDLAARHWRLLDLDSLMDFQHLSAFCDLTGDSLTVLEVGSGFGRLPEFLMKCLDRKIRYINVDAVPVSMMWFDAYMRRAFPDLRVATVTGPDSFDIAEFDIVTIPAWHLETVALPQVDIGINIESLQEMSQALVDGYVAFFDRTVRPGGTILLINSREHLFIGDWNFPAAWRCLFRSRTPRAWTDDYRTEVFEKTDSDCSGENALREANYQRELALTRYYRKTVEATDKHFNPHSMPGD